MQMGAMRIGIGHARGKPLLAKLLAEVSALGGVLYAPPVSGDWLFQTTTGETVSGASDPVGLMLDVSEGARKVGSNWQALGPELVTNGDFATGDLTGWGSNTGNPEVIDGVATATTSNTGFVFYQTVSVTPGKLHLLTFDITSDLFGVWGYNSANLSGGAAFNQETGPVVFIPTTSVFTIGFYSANASERTHTLDNVSIREIPGDHATQSVSASRPTVGVEWDGKGGLGPELVTNGDFATGDLTGWASNTGNPEVINGVATATTSNTGFVFYQTVSVTPGKLHLLTFDITSDLFGVWGYNSANLSGQAAFNQETGPVVFIPTTSVFTIGFYSANSSERTHTLDNVSIKEIPPASQRVYLDCDGTDDHLTTSVTPGTSGALLAAFRADASSAGVDVVAGGMGSSDGRAFLGANDGVLVAGVGALTESTLAAATDLRGGWAVGGVRWDGSDVDLWQNGAQVDTATASGAPDDTIGGYWGALNNNGSPANYFYGRLAVGARFPVKPTNAQMARIMNLMGQLVGTV